MKRLVALLLALVMLFALAACGAKTAAPTDEPSSAAGEEETTKWKDKMASLEKPTDAPRVVIFQNFIKFDDSVKDFADFGGKPTADGKTYSLATLDKVLTQGVEGDLTILDKDGNSKTASASDLAVATVTVGEEGTGSIKIGSVTVDNFAYLITANKEALLFVNPEETITLPDMFKALGYDACTNVFATASDGYWCLTDNAKEAEGSEIRGTLSGAVNCNLAVEGKGGAGKLNDLFYIDIVD